MRPRALALLGVLAVAASVAQAFDWRAWQRHRRAPAEPIGAVGWYTPTETIGQGSGTPLRIAAPAARTLDAAALDGAQRYAVEKNSYALIVAHRGVVQLEYYKDGFGPERALESQSMHKPLAAILTMAAVADGRLALDDPLGKFIPAWRDDARGRITVRDVLYMQTGLVEPRFEQKWGNPAYQMFITSHLDDAVLALGVDRPPGEYYASHYAATQLLQLVLEAATGQRYARYLNERLWSRLGAGEAQVRLDRPGGNAQVFCCIQARPRDWLRVGLLLSRHGEFEGRSVLPMSAFLELTTPSRFNPNFAMQQIWRGHPYRPIRMMDSRNPSRGLPVSAPYAAEDAFYLEGRGGQRVYVVPSRELVVVRQGEIRMEWDDAAFINGLIAGVPAASTVTLSTAAPAALPPPSPAFSALLAPPAPDYARDDAWARRPPSSGGTDATARAAAAFYIHPTTYNSNALWNAPHAAPDVIPGVDAVVAGQASVLDRCCEVWAPRYRQASIAALGASMQPYDLAYLDVVAAFRQFLARIGDRPFVILGHSQGALHAQRLITEVVDPDAALASRLVAGYVVGIPVAEAVYAKTLTRVRACTTPTQTGCIASWATFSERFPALPQWRAGARARFAPLMTAAGTRAIQCTNPLLWQAGEASAAAVLNLGATLPDPASGALRPLAPALVGAQCMDGALVVTPEPPPPFSLLALAPGNYHLADVALFHENVARNMAERADAWQAARR